MQGMEPKMTIEDKVKAYEMRLQGYTLQEIADRFHVSRQRIQALLPGKVKERNLNFKVVYPNLRTFFKEHEVREKDLSQALGVSRNTMGKWMRGAETMPKRAIDKLLAFTGMTYEEAFQRED